MILRKCLILKAFKLNDRSKCIRIHNKYFSSKDTNIKSNEKFGAQYCLNVVQQYDHENFISTLLLNESKRRYAFCLRAFNVEVARIANSVSEETIGKLRLKFWHDSIDKTFDTKSSYVQDHPVLSELKNTVENNKLTKIYLKRLVAARDRPANHQFLTIKEMEAYAEASVSSLYYLLLEIWGVKNMNVDHAISHLGKAQGVINLLRAIPYKGRNEAVTIPQEVLMKHGVSQERIIRDQIGDKGVEECIFEIATVAHQHLEQSRKLSSHVSKNISTLFLPAIAVERFLEKLRKANFRLSDQKVLQRDQMLPVALYWNKIRRKY